MSLSEESFTETDYECCSDYDDTLSNEQRQPSSVRCPQGGTDAELQRVMHAGGDFIDRPVTLGKNMKGDRDLYVSPVISSGEIVVIKPGKGKSAEAAFESSAKQLSLMYGHHDTSKFEAWKNEDGEILPPIEPNLLDATPRNILRPFCDNIICWTLTGEGKEKSNKTKDKTKAVSQKAGDSGPGYERIRNFFTALNLHVRKMGSASGGSAGFRCSIKCLGSNQHTDGREYKKFRVGLADVPLEHLSLILDLFRLICDTRGQESHLSDSRFTNIVKNHKEIMTELGIEHSHIATAFGHGQHIYYQCTDITGDTPGTLNPPAMGNKLTAMGYEIEPKMDCGRNIIRTKQFTEDEQSMSVKFYNKSLETLEQADVRSKTIDCKVPYLLNASTDHMNEIQEDPNVFENGHTRCEISNYSREYDVGRRKPARLQEMLDTFFKFSRLLDRTTLVKRSLHDLFEGLGKHVGRSIIVWNPAVYSSKVQCVSELSKKIKKNISSLKAAQKEKRQAKTKDFIDTLDSDISSLKAEHKCLKERYKQRLNSFNTQSDGFLIRYQNVLTGKFNGLRLISAVDKQQSGFDCIKPALVWGTSVAENPLLAVLVAGGPGTNVTNLYFRLIEIQRYSNVPGSELFTCFAWDGNFERGNYSNHKTDWSAVGVRNTDLTNLRPKVIGCMDPTPDYLSMGGLDIEVAGTDHSDIASQVDSEVYENIMGTPKQCFEVSEHNGSLDEYTECSEVKIVKSNIRDEICEDGQSPRKIRFKANGDWFNVPKACTEAMLSEIGGVENIHLVVKVNADTHFFWRMNKGFLHIQGNIKATSALPAISEFIDVLGGGLENIGKGGAESDMGMYVCTNHGKFYLSKSVKSILEVRVKDAYGNFNSELVENFMSGKRLLHQQSLRARIPGEKNPEELISIMDAMGQVIATNIGVSAKPRGRKRKSPE